jgi:hypothetical protein
MSIVAATCTQSAHTYLAVILWFNLQSYDIVIESVMTNIKCIDISVGREKFIVYFWKVYENIIFLQNVCSADL